MEIIRKKINTSDYENAMEANLGILARQQISELATASKQSERFMSLAFE